MKLKILLLSLASLSLNQSFSQVLTGRSAEAILPQANEIKIDDRLKSPAFIGFKPGSVISANAIESIGKALKMQSEDTYLKVKEEKDEIGMLHNRYQQLYKGIKVEFGFYILHERNGMLVSANGKFFEIGYLNITPGLSSGTALKAALREINAEKYMWQDEAEEALLRLQNKDKSSTWYPKGELVVLPGNAIENVKHPILCWKFDVYATKPLGRYYIYINATDGKVLFKENRICNVAVIGKGNTKYNGTQTFGTDSTAPNNYRLRDNSRATGVETYNMVNGTNYGLAVDFTDADNDWTSVVNQDDAALDAHWGAETTYDYFLNVHGRNSYDNLGAPLRSYVHYSSGYNNAFWDGSRMTYGDGNGITFSPLTELDVCGHELAHGVTGNSSALIYANESGALNESFSDIFGKTIDFYANPLTANWLIGAKCYTPGTPGDALRFMNDPNAAGDPDTYHGLNWYNGTGDNGGVHTNSGVQNFWYYLLSIGGTGTNDIGFNYNVTGIGIDKARRIAYRNNNFYLTSASGYADAAYFSLRSANDLFGLCSPEAVQVKNAWDAVGINTLQLNTSASAYLNNPPCIGGSLQLEAAGGTTYLWSGPNGFSSILKSPVISNVPANANGLYTCVVSDANGCSGAATVNIILNNPPVVNAGTDVTICSGSSAALNAIANVFGNGNNLSTNATPLALPDFPAPAVYSSIIIGGAMSASSVISVTIDSLTHTWDGDLNISLIAPDGSEIVLSSGNGSSGQNFLNTKFTPGSQNPITTGTAPFNGTYAPEQSFSSLTGTGNGTWKMKIQDIGGLDIGTLWKWSIVLMSNNIISYNWTPSATLTNSFISNPIAQPPFSTMYNVNVTDDNGCSSIDSVDVTIVNPVILASLTNATCGLSNGIINITVTGVVGINSYNWSNGATTEDLNNIAAGTYSITITNGTCVAGSSFTIQSTLGGLPLTPAGINGNISACTNQNNITYSILPVAGATGYSWSLPSGVTGSSNTTSIVVSFGTTFSGGNICASATNDCGASMPACLGISQIAAAPARPSVINGLATVCKNTIQTYSVPSVANATIYNWTVPANSSIVGGAGTNSIQLSFNSSWVSGNLVVSSGNCFGNSSTRTVSLRSLPSVPVSITGDRFAVCSGTTHPFTAPSTVGATNYLWTYPAGGTITGQGTTNVQITFPTPFSTGNVAIQGQNTCGLSVARSISVRSIATTPGTISGPVNNNCGAANAVYTIAASTTGATGYTWAVPAFASIISGQNTTSIHVSFIGSGTGLITVKADNACGSSTNRSLSVTTTPAQPAAINGTSTVCANQSGVAFNVTSQPGVNYNWTLPAGGSVLAGQGTSSVTVKWGAVTGNISVVASNSCGTAASRTKSVIVNCRLEEGVDGDEATLFPNPAVDYVMLSINSTMLHNYNFEIIDMLGNEVMKNTVYADENKIFIGNLAQGIYMLRLNNEDGLMKMFRVIKQ